MVEPQSTTDRSRVVLITGASRGIGEAAAYEFAQRGYRVAMTARDETRLEAVRQAIVEQGGAALVVAGDLHDLEFAQSVVTRTLEQWGQIDVLINNAIWRELITMRDISLESWERTLRLGLTVPAFLARWCAVSMTRRQRGVILNVSSIMSQQAAGMSPAYIACKGGLESLTYELASLYGPVGIRVVSIAPGAIDTELSRDYGHNAGLNADDPMERFSRDMIMLGRWGTPLELAKFMAFVASDDASYLTGTTLTLDGGWRHQHVPRSLRNVYFPEERP